MKDNKFIGLPMLKMVKEVLKKAKMCENKTNNA